MKNIKYLFLMLLVVSVVFLISVESSEASRSYWVDEQEYYSRSDKHYETSYYSRYDPWTGDYTKYENSIRFESSEKFERRSERPRYYRGDSRTRDYPYTYNYDRYKPSRRSSRYYYN